MRPLAFYLLSGLLCLAPSLAVQAEDWPAVRQGLLSQAETTRQQAKQTRQLIEMDKADLKSKLDQLRDRLHQAENDLEKEKDRYHRAQDKLEAAKSRHAKQTRAIEALKQDLGSSANRLRKYLAQASPNSFRRHQGLLNDLKGQRGLPRLPEIRGLVELYLDYIQESGRVGLFKAGLTAPDGKEFEARLVRPGPFTGAYDPKQGRAGLAQADKDLGWLGHEAAWTTSRQIKAYFRDYQAGLPLDLTGEVFKQGPRPPCWQRWIEQGGWFIWPLFAVALLALGLSAERLWTLVKMRPPKTEALDQALGLAELGRNEQALEFIHRARERPCWTVLARTLKRAPARRQLLEEVQQEAISGLLPRLERFLPTLQVLGAIAPLLGLLGTVTGMISTFETMTIAENTQPQLISGGISEALITTQIGLALAIPLLLVHHLFDRRVEAILADCESWGARLILALEQSGQVSREDEDAL